MKIEAQAVRPLCIPASEMKDGDFALVVTGQFAGEVLFRNVAGFHSLTVNRYWPSEYIAGKSDGLLHTYMPEQTVQLLQVGDVLTRTE
jgi:hypothetical protein